MSSETDVGQGSRSELTKRTGIIIITYDDRDYIEECLSTVFANDPGEVIVVDNGSTDGTVEFIETEFPEVDVIETEDNLGYGTASNRGVKKAESEYVVIMNPDTRIGSGSLQELLSPVAENNRVITVPKVLTYDGEETNTIGNVVHFTGLAFTRGYGDPPGAYAESSKLSGMSSVCFATTRETYEELGGFEESIFIYMDDTELSWRANAADLDILYVPTATLLHEYSGTDIDAEKLFHLERGRYIILRKHLEWTSAALVLPSLLLTEILTWGYSVCQGREGVKAKLRAVVDGFSAEVEPVETDGRVLLSDLDSRIPADQLQASQAVRMAIRVANEVYERNISILNL